MYYLYKDMYCKFSHYKITMQVQNRNSVHTMYHAHVLSHFVLNSLTYGLRFRVAIWRT